MPARTGPSRTRPARTGRANETREMILSVGERLFAEHGVLAVSNRQISEAAGQGNTFATGYHFGTKENLVRAIVRKHSDPIEQLRLTMLTQIGASTELRDWIACLVRPLTEHLADLDTPSWFARFSAQVMTEPTLRAIVHEDSLAAPSSPQIRDGLRRCRLALPSEVVIERNDMARHLLIHTCAERERALAESTPTPRATWHDAATGMIDAITGLWLAPINHDSGCRSSEA